MFKVETVGDCYVAAVGTWCCVYGILFQSGGMSMDDSHISNTILTGLPDARKDHALVMARFARDCLYKMHSTTKQLEVEL